MTQPPESNDPSLLEWFDEPPERRALDALAPALLNLTDLLRWACEDSPLRHSTLTFPVYIACVESFFTNARVVSEFFWKMPKKDITARLFVPDWNPPEAIACSMERVWLMASKHVVHLSQERVPTSPTDWRQEDLSSAALTRISDDAFEALRLLADAYEREGGAYAESLRQMCEDARPRTKAELALARSANLKPSPVVIEWW